MMDNLQQTTPRGALDAACRAGQERGDHPARASNCNISGRFTFTDHNP